MSVGVTSEKFEQYQYLLSQCQHTQAKNERKIAVQLSVALGREECLSDYSSKVLFLMTKMCVPTNNATEWPMSQMELKHVRFSLRCVLQSSDFPSQRQ